MLLQDSRIDFWFDAETLPQRVVVVWSRGNEVDGVHGSVMRIKEVKLWWRSLRLKNREDSSDDEDWREMNLMTEAIFREKGIENFLESFVDEDETPSSVDFLNENPPFRTRNHYQFHTKLLQPCKSKNQNKKKPSFQGPSIRAITSRIPAILCATSNIYKRGEHKKY